MSRFSRTYIWVLGCILFGVLSTHAEQGSSMRFIENKGQWDQNELYRVKLAPGFLQLQRDAFHFILFQEDVWEAKHDKANHAELHGHVHELKFMGANLHSTIISERPDAHFLNYYLGSDQSKWATGVKQFSYVRYQNIYDDVDLEVYGEGESVKYNWLLKPGADPSSICVWYNGVENLRMEKGALLYKTSVAEMKELPPVAWQEVNGQKRMVSVKYELKGDSVRLRVGRYDASLPLVIDPTLVFSSYTGSTADNFGFTATYDGGGNLYAGGNVFTPGAYPTVGAFQSAFGGGTYDMAISKFNASGTALMYSTYLGGSGDDNPHSLFVNLAGELYVFGSSNSSNFPTTAVSFDNSHNGGYDIVVVRFNASGSTLLNSTYVGGSGEDGFFTSTLARNYADEARGEIIVDSLGFVYVASYTRSTNFPTTAGAIRTTRNGAQDACVFRMPPNLSSFIFSTYLGGSGEDASFSLKLDQNKDIICAGGTASPDFPMVGGFKTTYGGSIDGWVAKINPTGSTILASTYLGTSAYDQVYFVEIDRYNNVYALGQTLGLYPVVGTVYSNSGGKQFIQKMNNVLNTSLVSTVFGTVGSSTINISPTAFLVDRCDNIYVSGWGGNVNSGHAGGNTFGLPITSGAIRSTTDGNDFYFIVFTRDARTLLYATYFGGDGATGEHVDGGTSRFDPEGVVYQAICSGCGGNSLFPTTPGAWSNTNRSSNCNLAAMKLAFNLAGTNVEVSASPRSTGCIPLTVNFRSILTSVRSVLWNFGDGTTSTLTNPTHVYTDSGRFRVMLIGIDSSSCNIADTAYLEVWARDDSISANFSPSLEVDCYTRTLSAVVRNRPGTNYTWNFGDGTSAATDSVYKVYASPGTYTISLQVVNPASCNGLSNFSQTFTIKPLVLLNVSLSDTSGCAPLTVNFTNSSSASASYRWSFGDGFFSTSRSTSHTYNEGGTYPVEVVLSDPASCNLNDTFRATITVLDDTVTPNVQIDRFFFGCDSVQVRLISLNPLADSVLWSLGDGSFSRLDTVLHTYRDSGVYNIVYRVWEYARICRQYDSLLDYVSLNPLDAAFDISDTNGCVPLSVNFKNLSGFASVRGFWDFGDGTSANGQRVTHLYATVDTFRIMHIAYDSSVCNYLDTSFATIITRNDSVQAAFASEILNDCDSLLLIKFTNQSVDAVQYEWYFGDKTFSDSIHPFHAYTIPGTYRVLMVAVDSFKCHPRDSAIAVFTLLPNAVSAFQMDSISCVGVPVILFNQSDSLSNFIWLINDTLYDTRYNSRITFNEPGTYSVKLVIDNSGTCDRYDTMQRQITILPYPQASFVTDKDSFYYQIPIQFTNTSTNYTVWAWRFGDGDTSVELNPVHTYNRIHELRPCITVSIAGTNCIDTFCRDIYVNFDAIIGVPNAFSPNGDGVNDAVKVEGYGIIELDFRIYNRWGELVFQSNNQKVGWDGIFRGVPQEMEVYAYTVSAVFLDKSSKILKGNISLLR